MFIYRFIQYSLVEEYRGFTWWITVELLYTVNPGIEDIASEEIRAELGGVTSFEKMSGHVYHVVDNVSFEAIYRLRSINRAFILLFKSRVGPRTNDLVKLREELVSSLETIHYYITPHTSFAVDTERLGSHEYTSMDISRIVGEIIIRKVEEKTGVKPVVNLRTPHIIIHVFVRDENFFLGVSLTGSRSLHRRGYRIYDHPAALKPTLAYAMLTLSGTRDKQVIVDPMCGGGTIPIEAGLLHEEALIYGYDRNPKHVRGAKLNAYASGVYGKVVFGVWDARRLHVIFDEQVDHIVSNPPYGIRYGDPVVIRKLYRDFLGSAYKSLKPGGRLTIITTEYNYVLKKAGDIGFRVIHKRTVQHGGLYPKIVVLEK
ncbi:THUMP domain-containing protein [Staphylothermus hellenicus]|uniref:THUMP domain-containing protein n=1 Tax=Staphylothermus hellenicus TaxID=84599 RepID=UPI001FDFC8DD|nr:THUMP domain-containing protein [Staphylothermus hellenicus]